MIKVERTKSRSAHLKYQLRIDNEIFRAGRTARTRDDRLTVYFEEENSAIDLEVKDLDLFKRITKHTFNEIPAQIKYLTLLSVNEYMSFESSFVEVFKYINVERGADELFEISGAIQPSSGNWDTPFSPAEFVVEFYKRLRTYYQVKFEDDELMFVFTFKAKNLDSTIEAETLAQRDKIQKIHDQTIAYLMSTVGRESVAVFFDFPDSIRTVCEQYLLYFGQFLKDLGVPSRRH